MPDARNITPLFSWHEQHGGKCIDFAGWDMPLHYQNGPIAEHRMVRHSAGLFDVSHMGRFVIIGTAASRFLSDVLTAPVVSLERDNASYALMCREDGGILDDIFVYRLSDGQLFHEETWLVVVNAANHHKDLAWLQTHAKQHELSLNDVTDSIAMIAFQGPNAVELCDMLSDGHVGAIPRFGARQCRVAGIPALVGRTGYTGEDGVELFVESHEVVNLWERILETGHAAGVEVGPVGLAARDSLRFEPGFALYGHELAEDVNPVEAGLKWACDFDHEFVGREAIVTALTQGATRKLVTLKLTEKGVPRQGYEVFDSPAGNESLGVVTSGMYAPTLDGYYANAYIRSDQTSRGTKLLVDIRGRKKNAIVVKRPIYRPAYRSS